MSKRKYKILKRSAWILLPLLLLLAGSVLYTKLYGFKKALEDFVYSRSKGEYVLSIKKSSIDIFDLNFTFQEVVIKRNLSQPGKSTHAVTIPKLRINFGSVYSMLAVKKFNIENMVIEEPLIDIDTPSKAPSNHKNTTLPQQIVKLYPAIESLLSSFDIKSLSIKRAALQIKKNNMLRIGLIDLLIANWNIERLEKNSQLLLHVGRQGLDFGKVSLDFAGVEYNFKERHLLFSDFKLKTSDTVSTSYVEVAAKSLLLNRLDYNELYENQRYVLQRAALESPVIRARFALKKGKKNQWMKDKGLLTRILKQTFGECIIDSAIIHNARLDLVLHKDKDSVRIDLPNVDFKLHSFKVLQDENTFRVGEMETNLKGTTVSLKNDLSLRFTRIFFSNERDLTITDVVILDRVKKKQFATIGRLKLDYADILPFIFNKHFRAQSVTVENAIFHIPIVEPHVIKKPSAGIKEVRIAHVGLKNITLFYDDNAGQHLSAKGLSAEAENIRYDSTGAIQYKLHYVKISQALIDRPKDHLHSLINNILINDHTLKASAIALQKDSLTITARNLEAVANEKITPEHYLNWNKIKFSDVDVKGHIPEKLSQQTGDNKEPFAVLIRQLQIDHLAASLSRREMVVSFSGNNIALNDLTVSKNKPAVSVVRGDFRNVDFYKPSLHAFAENLKLNYPDDAHLNDVRIENKSLNVILRSLSAVSIQNDKGSWRVNKTSARQIEIQRNNEIIFESDSVWFQDVTVYEQSTPAITRVEVFHPIIQNIPARSQKAIRVSDNNSSIPIPEKMIIHPGELRGAQHKPILFGKCDFDREKNSMRCAYVRTETEKMNLHLKDITLINDQVTIDSLYLLEKKDWIRDHPVENDNINASFSGISVKGFSYKAFLNKQPLKNLSLTMNGFDLDIRRDKRLPDPPPKDKPVTLDGMVHLPAHMRVNLLELKGGHVRYTETSDKTGGEGYIDLTDVSAEIKIDTVTSFLAMRAKATPYHSGMVDLIYQTIDSGSFKLLVKATDIDLTRFNELVVPFQAARITSGHLKEYDLNITATGEEAIGKAVISYSKLHFELFKKETPEKKNQLLTFIADGLVLRNKKNKATQEVYQVRLKNKSIFNYWVKCIVHGAVGAVRKGKREKPHID